MAECCQTEMLTEWKPLQQLVVRREEDAVGRYIIPDGLLTQ
jgi:hypothetical protein